MFVSRARPTVRYVWHRQRQHQQQRRRQRRDNLSSSALLEHVVSHPTEAALSAALAMFMARNLQLELRVRSQEKSLRELEFLSMSQVQSMEEQKRREEDLRAASEGKQKDLEGQIKELLESKQMIMEERQRLEASISDRGKAGEEILRGLLENAKAQGHVEGFELQPVISPGKKPDAVVELPGGTRLVVDSKAPRPPHDLLTAEESSDAENERRKYAGNLKTHVRQLSEKRYHADLDGSPPRTWMLLPGEGYLQAAYGPNGSDPSGLQAYAADRNVMLVGPNGLRSTLQLVSMQEAEAAEAARLKDEEVQENLRRLHPAWTENVLPIMRMFTKDMKKAVATANKVSENFIAFDEALRAEDALNLSKAEKKHLPMKIRDPKELPEINE